MYYTQKSARLDIIYFDQKLNAIMLFACTLFTYQQTVCYSLPFHSIAKNTLLSLSRRAILLLHFVLDNRILNSSFFPPPSSLFTLPS